MGKENIPFDTTNHEKIEINDDDNVTAVTVPSEILKPDKNDDENEEEDINVKIIPCLPAVRLEVPSYPTSGNGFVKLLRYILSWILFIVSVPFLIMFTWTIPNCSKPELQKYFLVSFTMSIVWIALLSFAMITTVGRSACILGVDKFTMGLVVIAIGTSVPVSSAF